MHNYDAQQHRAGQIIFPLTLQTITIAQMLSVGGEGASRYSTAVKWLPNDCNRISHAVVKMRYFCPGQCHILRRYHIADRLRAFYICPTRSSRRSTDTRQMVPGRRSCPISAGIVRVLLITGGSGASVAADEDCVAFPSFNTVSLDSAPALELGRYK